MELLVAVALVAIFAAVAVPSYHKLVSDNRITASLNAFAGTLAAARSEAVTRGRTVVVCPSTNATSTSPSCGGSAVNWSAGWISFVDANGDHAYGSGDTLLRVRGAIDGGDTLRSLGGAKGNYIAFNRMGFAQPTFSGTATSLTIAACPPDGDVRHARAIILGVSGSVHTASDTDTPADGIVNDSSSGGNVTCP